jgi:large subunit ribosomal protein L10e
MAKLRKFAAYRRLERPYTRMSKFRGKNFVRGSPHLIISQYDMGNRKKKFSFTLKLISKESLQIRQNSIESARMACNRDLETKIGKENYRFRIKMYPFHILRENPLAAGAGADRMSTGMQRSFGKVIGRAAQIRAGKELMLVDVDKQALDIAKTALHKAGTRLPKTCKIELVENR